MNNKGFMMAEVVVVSAIILVFMAGMYVSYNKVFAIYNQRVDYYDVTALYKLGYYRDLLIDYDKMNDYVYPKEEVGDVKKVINLNGIIDTGDTVYFVHNKSYNLNHIKNNGIIDYFNNSDINPTFEDYIDFLSTSATLKSNYVMIMETCVSTDDCKYAYLEVYDGKETIKQ